jgi:hypothetical protein
MYRRLLSTSASGHTNDLSRSECREAVNHCNAALDFGAPPCLRACDSPSPKNLIPVRSIRTFRGGLAPVSPDTQAVERPVLDALARKGQIHVYLCVSAARGGFQ